MDILTDLHKKNRIARILAKRDHFLTSKLSILQQKLNHLFPLRRPLRFLSAPQSLDSIPPQNAIRIDAKIPDSRNDGFRLDNTHIFGLCADDNKKFYKERG
jgi:hypothetical protein